VVRFFWLAISVIVWYPFNSGLLMHKHRSIKDIKKKPARNRKERRVQMRYLYKGMIYFISGLIAMGCMGIALALGVNEWVSRGVAICVFWAFLQVSLKKLNEKYPGAAPQNDRNPMMILDEMIPTKSSSEMEIKKTCPNCGQVYSPSDYSIDVLTWLCSSCKTTLPK
jgi:hypothetical protein